MSTPLDHPLLSHVRDHRATHDYGPSVTEIATALHMSKSTAFDRIQRAIAQGKLRQVPGVARSLNITDDGLAYLEKQ